MKNLWEEFKQFAFTGSVMDMAIGVILGGAIKDVVTSLVENIIMPILSGIIFIPKDISHLTLTINGSIVLKYGLFLSNLINFLLLALCIFLCVKAITRVKTMHQKEEEPAEVLEKEEVTLLREIRDMMQTKS